MTRKIYSVVLVAALLSGNNLAVAQSYGRANMEQSLNATKRVAFIQSLLPGRDNAAKTQQFRDSVDLLTAVQSCKPLKEKILRYETEDANALFVPIIGFVVGGFLVGKWTRWSSYRAVLNGTLGGGVLSLGGLTAWHTWCRDKVPEDHWQHHTSAAAFTDLDPVQQYGAIIALVLGENNVPFDAQLLVEDKERISADFGHWHELYNQSLEDALSDYDCLE